MADKPESELPSLVASLAPVLVPIFLISFASTLAALPVGIRTDWPTLYRVAEFAGNRNVALLIGVGLAVAVLIGRRGVSAREIERLVGPPLEVAAVVILITSAGGAYGLMLKNSGVGETVKALVAGREINLILLSWLVAAVIRLAQGSATVAMLTAAALVLPLLTPDLPFHPVYIFLSIGFGAMIFSWMNDSGFWVVSKLSGITEGETLKTWSVITTTNSLVGVVLVYFLAKILPFAS
jgi:GntP family gluconate:H+ symporter